MSKLVILLRLLLRPKLLWRDLFALFAFALLIRLLAALPQQQPNYMDAAYSYVNALNLAAGRGFVEDFVWIYLDDPGPPPHPSHLYWMPLTSILAWLGMIAGGSNYRAAQVPFILTSALLAPITYAVTCTISRQRWPGWLAGLLAIFSGYYFPFWTAIDNFTPFAVVGSLALLAAWWAMNNENYKLQIAKSNSQIANRKSQIAILALILAGTFVGLAHLARADGFLLLIAIILACFLPLFHRSGRPPEARRRRHAAAGTQASRITRHASRRRRHASITHHSSRITFPLLLGYLLIMTPWFIRNWLVIGAPLPTAGSQTIWLTNYDELFSYGRELSAQTFFAQGIDPVLQGRWWALTTNLQTVLAVWGMIFLSPLAVVGFWHLRRHRLIQLVGFYALLLFITMTLIFAFPGARGGLFHSGAALLPFIYAAAVVGLDNAIDWVAARRRHWNARLAKQFFGVAVVIMAILLSGFIYYRRVIKNNTWNHADRLYPVIAEWVSEQNPAATVMINNPPAYRYHGGGLSVVVPNEDIETTLRAASRYRVDYLVLERNHPVALTGIYNQASTPPQLSLVETFAEGTGNEVYVFEIVRP
jgi:hypothetical protein